MKTRKLGWTDLELTTVGFGAWAIGGNGWRFSWGPQDDDESVRAIRHAIDVGVNWIDTAAVYGFGHSEEIVGRALREMGSRPIVATKCSRLRNDRGEIVGVLKRDSIKREAEQSLRRLGIDVIDLYQIHWPQPDAEIEEAWETMAELMEEGKIRYAGVSNFSVSQMERLQSMHPIASLQPPYSMLRREIEEEILGYCARNSIGVVVYSPMQKGILTGKYTPKKVAELPPDDHRRNDPHFMDPELSLTHDMLERIRPIAERHGRTLAQLAIAWVLRRPELTAAIVGTRKPSQIEDTARAAEWDLTPDEITEIDRYLAMWARALSGE